MKPTSGENVRQLANKGKMWFETPSRSRRKPHATHPTRRFTPSTLVKIVIAPPAPPNPCEKQNKKRYKYLNIDPNTSGSRFVSKTVVTKPVLLVFFFSCTLDLRIQHRCKYTPVYTYFFNFVYTVQLSVLRSGAGGSLHLEKLKPAPSGRRAPCVIYKSESRHTSDTRLSADDGYRRQEAFDRAVAHQAVLVGVPKLLDHGKSHAHLLAPRDQARPGGARAGMG